MDRDKNQNPQDDRQRLAEGMHQTDLTESNVNEDFVDWLKTSGMTYLLIVLVAVAGYMLIVRWGQHKSNQRSEAWVELLTVQQNVDALPAAYEDVALKYGEIDGIARIAWLQAANKLMTSVQSGRAMGGAQTLDPANPNSLALQQLLTPDMREEYLTRAEGLYHNIVNTDDGTMATALHVISAMNGLAAIGEARGDLDAAQDWYSRAAERAEANYPDLASQARMRADQMSGLDATIELPRPGDPSVARPPLEPREPAAVDSSLRGLLLEDGDGG